MTTNNDPTTTDDNPTTPDAVGLNGWNYVLRDPNVLGVSHYRIGWDGYFEARCACERITWWDARKLLPLCRCDDDESHIDQVTGSDNSDDDDTDGSAPAPGAG